jgi:hypothetical protein
MACFLILSNPLLTYTISAKENFEKTNPTITVNGGIGIEIWFYNVDDYTTVGATIDGALLFRTYTKEYFGNRVKIHLSIFDFNNEFNLNVFVGDQTWSFNCRCIFFIFVYDIKPINM